MTRHLITRGLRLPISGEPSGQVEDSRPPRRVALLAPDYVGLRPTMQVSVGDGVSRGQLLFEDKTMPGVRYTAPAAGTVRAVNRGARRALQSVVIEPSRAEREGRSPEAAEFRSWSGRHPSGMTEDEVRDLLLESGQWTALRARPYSRVADPSTRPHSIFVTAVDTNPLAPDVAAVAEGREGAFERGLAALGRLTPGPVFVCTGPDQRVRVPTSASNQIRHEIFDGLHPAGTVGVHIHTLDPVDRGKLVWHIGFQDVIATGRLFETGSLDVSRIVALGGPPIARPRLLQTRIGASISELVDGDVDGAADHRVISGSVLSGRTAMGDVHGYLGRYHQQVSVLAEGRDREFLGWLGPGPRHLLDRARLRVEADSRPPLLDDDLHPRVAARHRPDRDVRAGDADGPASDPDAAGARDAGRGARRRSSAAWSWTRRTSPCARSSTRARPTSGRTCGACWTRCGRKADGLFVRRGS